MKGLYTKSVKANAKTHLGTNSPWVDQFEGVLCEWKFTRPSKDLRMYEKEHKTNQQKNQDAETKKRKQ